MHPSRYHILLLLPLLFAPIYYFVLYSKRPVVMILAAPAPMIIEGKRATVHHRRGEEEWSGDVGMRREGVTYKNKKWTTVLFYVFLHVPKLKLIFVPLAQRHMPTMLLALALGHQRQGR